MPPITAFLLAKASPRTQAALQPDHPHHDRNRTIKIRPKPKPRPSILPNSDSGLFTPSPSVSFDVATGPATASTSAAATPYSSRTPSSTSSKTRQTYDSSSSPFDAVRSASSSVLYLDDKVTGGTMWPVSLLASKDSRTAEGAPAPAAALPARTTTGHTAAIPAAASADNVIATAIKSASRHTRMSSLLGSIHKSDSRSMLRKILQRPFRHSKDFQQLSEAAATTPPTEPLPDSASSSVSVSSLGQNDDRVLSTPSSSHPRPRALRYDARTWSSSPPCTPTAVETSRKLLFEVHDLSSTSSSSQGQDRTKSSTASDAAHAVPAVPRKAIHKLASADVLLSRLRIDASDPDKSRDKDRRHSHMLSAAVAVSDVSRHQRRQTMAATGLDSGPHNDGSAQELAALLLPTAMFPDSLLARTGAAAEDSSGPINRRSALRQQWSMAARSDDADINVDNDTASGLRQGFFGSTAVRRRHHGSGGRASSSSSDTSQHSAIGSHPRLSRQGKAAAADADADRSILAFLAAPAVGSAGATSAAADAVDAASVLIGRTPATAHHRTDNSAVATGSSAPVPPASTARPGEAANAFSSSVALSAADVTGSETAVQRSSPPRRISRFFPRRSLRSWSSSRLSMASVLGLDNAAGETRTAATAFAAAAAAAGGGDHAHAAVDATMPDNSAAAGPVAGGRLEAEVAADVTAVHFSGSAAVNGVATTESLAASPGFAASAAPSAAAIAAATAAAAAAAAIAVEDADACLAADTAFYIASSSDGTIEELLLDRAMPMPRSSTPHSLHMALVAGLSGAASEQGSQPTTPGSYKRDKRGGAPLAKDAEEMMTRFQADLAPTAAGPAETPSHRLRDAKTATGWSQSREQLEQLPMASHGAPEPVRPIESYQCLLDRWLRPYSTRYGRVHRPLHVRGNTAGSPAAAEPDATLPVGIMAPAAGAVDTNCRKSGAVAAVAGTAAPPATPEICCFAPRTPEKPGDGFFEQLEAQQPSPLDASYHGYEPVNVEHDSRSNISSWLRAVAQADFLERYQLELNLHGNNSSSSSFAAADTDAASSSGSSDDIADPNAKKRYVWHLDADVEDDATQARTFLRFTDTGDCDGERDGDAARPSPVLEAWNAASQSQSRASSDSEDDGGELIFEGKMGDIRGPEERAGPMRGVRVRGRRSERTVSAEMRDGTRRGRMEAAALRGEQPQVGLAAAVHGLGLVHAAGAA